MALPQPATEELRTVKCRGLSGARKHGGAELKHTSRAIIPTVTTLLVTSVSPAYGYCPEPSAFPRAPNSPSSYERPDIPDCLSKHPSAGQKRCDPSETANYAADIARYTAKLRRYNDEVDRFAHEAATFVENAKSYIACEVEALLQPD
jgi:hypothetical protein